MLNYFTMVANFIFSLLSQIVNLYNTVFILSFSIALWFISRVVDRFRRLNNK